MAPTVARERDCLGRFLAILLCRRWFMPILRPTRVAIATRVGLRIGMNHRRQSKIARNRPKQSRSRATVGAILEAMIRVLDQEGYEAATTTRVAEVAGVSIGTLYQYFSNRDAILDALQDRELSRAWEFMESVLGEAHRYSEHE